VNQVIDWINKYKNSPAQLKVDGKPMVSTFEGPGWADNWAAVRQATGNIYLVPDWTSLGPQGFAGRLNQVDGACKLYIFSFLDMNFILTDNSLLGRLAGNFWPKDLRF
jgi:Glycosyl hydrolase family 71